MTTRLPVQTWMSDPAAIRVMTALDSERPGCARYVGGCVRNALLGEPVLDVDIATQLRPETVAAVLGAAGVAVHPTGIEHGTITAVADGKPFEITSLRRDVETDGRRAVVAFTESWEEDAQRRDFRLNALYASADGEVFDPTGAGLADLAARRIVFIGEPDQRIREDYLRILRFFRFNAWYGRPSLNAEGLAACARLRDGLSTVSVERIWMELKKLLAAPRPERAVAAMAQTGVLPLVLPEAHGVDHLSGLVAVEQRIGLGVDPLRRFMSLFSRDAERLRGVAARLRMSNDETLRLAAAARDDRAYTPDLGEREARKALYQAGETAYRDRLILAWAQYAGGDARDEDWRSLLVLADQWRRPRLPVSGDDALACGVEPGPAVGRFLREAEARWILSDFTASRDALLADC